MEGYMATDRLQLLTTLYDAALEGDVPSFQNLLRMDPRILDRCIIEKSGRFPQSPLHVAAKFGHLQFVIELLRREPRLAEELDQAQRLSPLHVAAANGREEIVKALLSVNPNMCFVRSLDGLNPIHVAVISGRTLVLHELLQAKPQAVKELNMSRETVLHLCVKHGQVEPLRSLIDDLDDVELLNHKDPDGNTILHLAVATRQIEMIKIILGDKRMNKNAINANGLTAMDICKKFKKDSPTKKEIKNTLEDARALRAMIAASHQNTVATWTENQRDTLMVVASLIAVMAFQVAVNPPGGPWQDDKDGPDGHAAGFAIMATQNIGAYKRFLISNTIALISSLSVILLLISGFRYKRCFMTVLMTIMWLSVSTTAYTCMVGMEFLSSGTDSLSVWGSLMMAFYGWIILMGVLLLGHVLKFMIKMIKNLVRCVRKMDASPTTSLNHTNGV